MPIKTQLAVPSNLNEPNVIEIEPSHLKEITMKISLLEFNNISYKSKYQKYL